MLVVNLVAGPGAGKSTMAAEVFARLKWRGVNCELVREFAKEVVWEGNTAALDDQLYLFGQQSRRFSSLAGKVDVAVTDSPLLLSAVYGRHLGENFEHVVWDAHADYDNMVYFVERTKPYHEAGRVQSEAEAKALDVDLRRLLSHNVAYKTVQGNSASCIRIVRDVLARLSAPSRSRASSPSQTAAAPAGACYFCDDPLLTHTYAELVSCLRDLDALRR